MQPSLLATKLRVPPQPHHAVHRPRLGDVLERIIPHHKLILIAAPAGYGKTTLLSQWAHASRFPVAWLAINEEDNDLERFFRYLLTGWEAIQPGVIESPLGLLLGGIMLDSQAILASFINVANQVPDHIVFVLDDYHLIEDPSKSGWRRTCCGQQLTGPMRCYKAMHARDLSKVKRHNWQ
jgi:LuxR family maltose regulon positive regulatory protein